MKKIFPFIFYMSFGFTAAKAESPWDLSKLADSAFSVFSDLQPASQPVSPLISKWGVGHLILETDYQVDLSVPISIPESEYGPSVELYGTLVCPNGQVKPRATILVLTPYRREWTYPIYLNFIDRGYNLLVVDVRGTGSSHGTWQAFGLVEHFDAKYIIDEWIPSQLWSDQTVGMVGSSYLGVSQLLASGLVERDENGGPKHLKAIVPGFLLADTWSETVYQGGLLNIGLLPGWLSLVNFYSLLPPLQGIMEDGGISKEKFLSFVKTIASHLKNIPTSIEWLTIRSNLSYGSFFEARSTMLYWPKKPRLGWELLHANTSSIPAELPTLVIAGWKDIFLKGSLYTYQNALKRHDQGQKAMIIGDWYHLDGIFAPGIKSLSTQEFAADWFDQHLKNGRINSVRSKFPVLIHVNGINKWRAEKSWPLPKERLNKETLFLSRKRASRIEHDWFSKMNSQLNYSLSETLQTRDAEEPKLKLFHDPKSLKGSHSRSAIRWTFGLAAMPFRVLKNLWGFDFEPYLPWGDERKDEVGSLTFTSASLEKDTEIIGGLVLKFWAKTKFLAPLSTQEIRTVKKKLKTRAAVDDQLISTLLTRKDVHWIAELNDVHQGGRTNNVSSGWLSSWHRPNDSMGSLSSTGEQKIDPEWLPFKPLDRYPPPPQKAIEEGRLYQYALEILPTSHVFKAGHRIRVSLSHSDFPHLLPNLNPAESEIVIDSRHPATLEFHTTNLREEGHTWRWVHDPETWLLADE